jgi:hypothetical protein
MKYKEAAATCIPGFKQPFDTYIVVIQVSHKKFIILAIHSMVKFGWMP